MSIDVMLDNDGSPDFTKGDTIINGVDELRQSLRLRLMSSVGWAQDDEDFGIEWLGFFGTAENADIAAAKIAESYEKDDRVAQVLQVDVIPQYKERVAQVKVKLRLADPQLIAGNDGDPNLQFVQNLGF